MGSCCGTKSSTHPGVRAYKKNEEHKLLPKVIVISEDCGLIYFDCSPTSSSIRLGNSLKHKFPNLVSCDSERRIFKKIEMMKERKYYIIIVSHIREETLTSLLRNSKVKAIYFALEQNNIGHHSKSRKMKGFFKNQMELKEAIYYDVRLE